MRLASLALVLFVCGLAPAGAAASEGVAELAGGDSPTPAAPGVPVVPEPEQPGGLDVDALGMLVLEVQASRLPSRLAADPTAAGVVIERSRLVEPGAELHEALAETPGVRSLSSGGPGRFATLSIRGSTAQQVVITLEDVPLADSLTGLVDLGSLPVEHLSAVEIYRGLSPLSVPTGAIGGAVRLRLPEADRDRLTARVGAGSFGTAHGSVEGAWRPARVLGVAASLGALASQGDFPYPSDNGTAFDASDDAVRRRGNNDLTRLYGMLRLQANPLRRLRVGLTHLAWRDAGGVPGHGLQNDTSARRDDRRYLTIAAFEQPSWPNHGWRQSQQFWWLHARDQLQDPWAEFGPDRNDADDRSDAWGGRWMVEGTPTAWLDLGLMLGGGLERYHPSDALDSQTSDAVSTRTRLSAGMQPRIVLPWGRGVDLVSTARLERLDSQVHDYTFRGIALAPPSTGPQLLDDLRFGVRIGLADGLDALANVGRAERGPSFVELFGDGAVILPNGALKSETGRFADLGLRWRRIGGFGWISADLHGWVREVDGLIQFVRSSPETVRAENLDGARMGGFEAGAVAELLDHLAVRGSYAYTTTKTRSAAIFRNGRELPFQPSSTWFLRLGPYHRFAVAWLQRAGVWAEGDWQAGSFLDPANRIVLPARFVVNAGLDLGWLANEALRLQLIGRNLADTTVVDLLGWPRPGRSFAGTLSWSPF